MVHQGLVKHMVVGIKRFLCVKPGACDRSGRIINRYVKVPDLPGNPFEGRSVHLKKFAETGGSGAA